MNTSLINETNTKLNEIIEHLKGIKDQYESKLATNKSQIDDELAKVDEYKSLFYEAKKKIQKMSDDINGFEEDYRNLVEKFQDDELANILIGVSKEINAKIKEKKRNIQKDQQEMNALIDKAQEAKKSLVRLTAEKKGLENTLRQVTDVFKYYSEEFERISMYTSENFDNLHPDDEVFDTDNVEKELNIDEIEIDEKEEVLSDEEIESSNDVVDLEINEPTPEDEETEDAEEYDDSEFEEAIDENQESDNDEVEEEFEDEDEETPEEEEEQVDFDVDNIVVNDDLEDDDEESIRSFLDKDENDLF